MMTRALGAQYRTTTVCIDSYEGGVPAGRFYNPWLETGRSFQSMSGFLLEMEQALDSMDFPKSFTAVRTFAQSPPGFSPAEERGFRPGCAATFEVRILFRQNASWQGSVTWLEGRREQSFRSVLELILLMDSALGQKTA
jgi:hypothetical protein